MSQIWNMAQRPPRGKDNWGTRSREGYEDRGAFRPPRTPQKERGSPLLRTMGGLSIVGGICWGAYLVTSGGDVATVLRENHGPIAIIGLGVVASVVGKYIRG